MIKKSTLKLLRTLQNGGTIHRQVHQSTIENAVLNGWIARDDGATWYVTDLGYDALRRSM